MNEEFEWKAAQREAARQELVRRAAEEQTTMATWCVAWFAQAERLGLKEQKTC